MSGTVLNIRIDKETKEEISSFASSIGLTTSAFATAVLKQAIHNQEVVLRPVLKPTEKLERMMLEVNRDIKASKNISKGYKNVDDMFNDLES